MDNETVERLARVIDRDAWDPWVLLTWPPKKVRRAAAIEEAKTILKFRIPLPVLCRAARRLDMSESEMRRIVAVLREEIEAE